MRNNVDNEQKKKIVEFILNFLKNEGFTDVTQPEMEASPSVKIEDQLTQKVYFPTVAAQKDGKLYIIDVETDGKYSKERILRWKLYKRYLEEKEGVFWMFVPGIVKEIFQASLKQNKLEELVEVIAY